MPPRRKMTPDGDAVFLPSDPTWLSSVLAHILHN
jgi:hypothetical protein